MSSKIETYSGLYIDPFNLCADDIRIQDIAHALANQCRFSGHTKRHYSVAEHSWWVSKRLGGDPRMALLGLLHDASEAILVDIPSPLKRQEMFKGYRELEEKIQHLIYMKYTGLKPTPEEHEKLKEVDILVRKAEQLELMVDHPDIIINESAVIQWSARPQDPKKAFLDRFTELI